MSAIGCRVLGNEQYVILITKIICNRYGERIDDDYEDCYVLTNGNVIIFDEISGHYSSTLTLSQKDTKIVRNRAIKMDAGKRNFIVNSHKVNNSIVKQNNARL